MSSKDTNSDMPIGIRCAPDGGGCAHQYIKGERWCGQPESAPIHHVTQTYSHGFVPVEATVATFDAAKFRAKISGAKSIQSIHHGGVCRLDSDVAAMLNEIDNLRDDLREIYLAFEQANPETARAITAKTIKRRGIRLGEYDAP